MSIHGRFGKYGDNKRIARLRQARVGPGHFKSRVVIRAEKGAVFRKKSSERGRVRTRQARASDVDYIRILSRKVFIRYGPYDEILSRWFLTDLTLTFLATLERRPAGFAMLGRPAYKWYLPNACELLAIAVEPVRQRCGIGDLLMKDIVNKAAVINVDKVFLHTALENLPAQRLFKRHGFVPIEVKKGFYPEGQDALMMYRDIF